jgi:FixJ family two-component response regulator
MDEEVMLLKGRLLVLEDDAHVAQVIAIIAESCGLEARIFTDHRRFFGALEEWTPSHIALDWLLPGNGGEHILAELARRDSSAQIIITSGSSARVLATVSAGASQRGLNVIGVLAKPFSAAALRDLLSDRRVSAGEFAHGLADEPAARLPLGACLS